MITTLLAVLVIALDRAVKLFASSTLKALPGGMPLWPGVLRLFYAENTGMAFGLMPGQRLFFAAATAIALAAAFVAFKKFRLTRLPKIALGLALGGTVGNLIDRLFFGFVVDMFDFEFMRFAVFNIADAALSVGVCLLIISILFMPKAWEAKK